MSIYKDMMATYFEWYKDSEGIKPRINAVEGASLKKLIQYLTDINEGDEVKALEVFKVILGRWKTLDEFYQKQKDLKQINSNINAIIRQLKSKGQHFGRSSAKRDADDLRQGL